HLLIVERRLELLRLEGIRCALLAVRIHVGKAHGVDWHPGVPGGVTAGVVKQHAIPLHLHRLRAPPGHRFLVFVYQHVALHKRAAIEGGWRLEGEKGGWEAAEGSRGGERGAGGSAGGEERGGSEEKGQHRVERFQKASETS
ncbi:MAG: hypothetical protein SGPRY_014444, partial [Prymnesium sp.]